MDGIELIQRTVAARFGLVFADMQSKRRPNHVAGPRQIAMALAREMCGASLVRIGERFGGRDHATVLHAVASVKMRSELEPQYKAAVDSMRAAILPNLSNLKQSAPHVGLF